MANNYVELRLLTATVSALRESLGYIGSDADSADFFADNHLQHYVDLDRAKKLPKELAETVFHRGRELLPDAKNILATYLAANGSEEDFSEASIAGFVSYASKKIRATMEDDMPPIVYVKFVDSAGGPSTESADSSTANMSPRCEVLIIIATVQVGTCSTGNYSLDLVAVKSNPSLVAQSALKLASRFTDLGPDDLQIIYKDEEGTGCTLTESTAEDAIACAEAAVKVGSESVILEVEIVAKHSTSDDACDDPEPVVVTGLPFSRSLRRRRSLKSKAVNSTDDVYEMDHELEAQDTPDSLNLVAVEVDHELETQDTPDSINLEAVGIVPTGDEEPAAEESITEAKSLDVPTDSDKLRASADMAVQKANTVEPQSAMQSDQLPSKDFDPEPEKGVLESKHEIVEGGADESAASDFDRKCLAKEEEDIAAMNARLMEWEETEQILLADLRKNQDLREVAESDVYDLRKELNVAIRDLDRKCLAKEEVNIAAMNVRLMEWEETERILLADVREHQDLREIAESDVHELRKELNVAIRDLARKEEENNAAMSARRMEWDVTEKILLADLQKHQDLREVAESDVNELRKELNVAIRDLDQCRVQWQDKEQLMLADAQKLLETCETAESKVGELTQQLLSVDEARRSDQLAEMSAYSEVREHRGKSEALTSELQSAARERDELQDELRAEVGRLTFSLQESKLEQQNLRTKIQTFAKVAELGLDRSLSGPLPSGRTLSSYAGISGIEAESEDAGAAGDVTALYTDALKALGARQAFRIGRATLTTGQDHLPLSYSVTVANDGEVAWPATCVLFHVMGPSLEFPLATLEPLQPGARQAVDVDLVIPQRIDAGSAVSMWALGDARSNTLVGPVLVFETHWVDSTAMGRA